MAGSPTASAAPPHVVAAHVLPARLAAALHCAHAAELTASGDRRRPAFALTRALLAGARRAGYPASLLAQCLGVSVDSIRNRSGGDERIAAGSLGDLDVPPLTAQRWRAEGLLSENVDEQTGRRYYPASELVRALTRGEP